MGVLYPWKRSLIDSPLVLEICKTKLLTRLNMCPGKIKGFTRLNKCPGKIKGFTRLSKFPGKIKRFCILHGQKRIQNITEW